jgi:hypothetical protein
LATIKKIPRDFLDILCFDDFSDSGGHENTFKIGPAEGLGKKPNLPLARILPVDEDHLFPAGTAVSAFASEAICAQGLVSEFYSKPVSDIFQVLQE